MHRLNQGKISPFPLLIVALFAISVGFFPFHTALAAPQRPLSGCNNNSYTLHTGFGSLGITDLFTNFQQYDCYQWSSMDDVTYFAVGSGNTAYIVAQGDTWLTQNPYPGGERRGETGRSNQVAYPDNGQYYRVQAAIIMYYLTPMYGCNWVNWPQLGFSMDYNCSNMV